MPEKRVLYITRTDPTQRGGGNLATRAFIMGFNSLYPGKVDLIMADSCITNDFDLPVEYYLVPSRDAISRYLSILTGNLHRFKDFVYDYLSVKKDKYQLCIFNGSLIAGDMVDFVNSMGIKTITIHHNYEREYHMDNKTLETFKGTFPYYVVRNERNAYLKSSLNLFLTNQDNDVLLKIYGQSKGVNKVVGIFEPAIEDICIKSERELRNLTMVISGTMSTHQTMVGIKDFYAKYFPLLKQLYPELKILFTGKNPNKRLRSIVRRENSKMEIIPNPKEIDKIISLADIYLCPTNIGGGIKLRLMDGLKSGLPILVHAVSARGYEMFLNKPWFKVYNDEDSFYRGLASLIEGLKQRDWASLSIQKAYLEHFSLSAGINRLRESLNT
jgi:glycosyltransferase involved in cell wall biosynthesis